MCGADNDKPVDIYRLSGSPPRVRSRHAEAAASPAHRRITSACAEQTGVPVEAGNVLGDHLRVCGADANYTPGMGDVVGSPPRVRSRRCLRCSLPHRCRITSACAEQTAIIMENGSNHGDHLRVCGADTASDLNVAVPTGSPPRVRSRLLRWFRCILRVGITSACAEQTRPVTRRVITPWDHLRVCGAD